jgi:hypothetical protein
MYGECDEDRISAAEELTDHNPRAAAEGFLAIAAGQACLSIARDTEVGDEVRLSAAELIAAAGVDPRAASEACLSIARDPEVGDEVRLSAAEQLAAIDQHRVRA